MSALKNLIKTAAAVAVFFCFSVPTEAQILGMGVNFEKLNLPQAFFQNLENCKDYHYEYSAGYEDIKVKTTYTIKPQSAGMCDLYVDAWTNVSVHITQNCKFTAEQAKDYATALKKYQAKGYSPRWDGEQLENDTDYLAAYKIMSDRNLCKFQRDEIDNSKNIRPNLLRCSPAKQVESTAGLEVTRQIIGVEDSLCRYQFGINQLEVADAATNKKQKNGKIEFDCRFNLAQNARYLRILEAMVVPAEEGYDFSAVQRIWPQTEIEFILDNCSLVE